MKDPANYGDNARSATMSEYKALEARVRDLEEALVHSIGKRIKTENGYPPPIEEAYTAPMAFEGPYSLNFYKPDCEEWFTSGIACSTDAMETAKELSASTSSVVRVRDKKGCLVKEFKP